jgi:tetratricopeptide (TPR) repeat protein
MTLAPTISLCMIVRDEERTLARCLESVSPFVDEMVIVDTGSKDGTVSIAESFGARVIHEEWQDDFSAARNRSLEEARGGWILCLDADEIISPEAGEDLRRIASNKDVVCASFDMRCAEADDQETLSSMIRAFQRRDDIRYRYRLHEQVLPDIKAISETEGLRREHCAGEIFHDGYLPEIVDARNKDERNLRLYELQLADSPDDLYVLFKYADFLRRFPEHQERSRQLLETCFDQLAATPDDERRELTFAGQVCALLGQDLQKEGDCDRSWEVTRFGMSNCRETADLLYVHGNNALLAHEPAVAEDAFERCRAMAGKAGSITTLPHITGLGARMGLARARFMQGWDEESAEEASDILEDHPGSDEALDLWADILTRNGEWSQMTERIITLVQERPEWGLAWRRGGECLFRLNMHQKAIPWLMRAAELSETPGGCLAVAGECFMALGLAEKALEAFEAGLPDQNCHAGLIVLQLLCRIDPEEELDGNDQAFIRTCRQMLERVRRIPDHPFGPRLSAAHQWIESIDSSNRPFLEQTVSAGV